MNNNPMRYTDPSGHDVDCGLGDPDCQAGLHSRKSQPIPYQTSIPNASSTTNGTTVGTQSEDSADSLGDVLSTVAAGSDLVAFSINLTQVGMIDGIGGLYILISSIIPGGALEATSEVLFLDYMMRYNPLSIIENILGGVSLVATAVADYVFGNTDLLAGYIGVDTLVAARSTVLGLIPEVNVDAAVSLYQLTYDFARADGLLPGGSVPINLNTFLGLLSNWPLSNP
jgi:hypothetical protein